jgi:uncharacterized membrane protein YczE
MKRWLCFEFSETMKYKALFFRGIYAILGITIISIGITFMRYSGLGVDPITCLNTGVAKQIGLPFGTWQLIMFLVMVIGIFFFDRSKIGFGTLYNSIVIGYTSDFLLWVIKQIPLFESFSINIRTPPGPGRSGFSPTFPWPENAGR